MSIFQRKLLCDMASTVVTSEPEDACGDMQAETELQDVLFSEVATSVCYWATVLLLAIAGTGLLYWRFTHPGPFAVPVGDPFGVTTPPWLIVSLPPIGVSASLGHAAWSAVRGQRIWRMLAAAAGLIAVMGAATLIETHLAAL
jgi:hypothetical protein